MTALLSPSINGVPSCANRKLLTDILRNEMGFQGYVVSDEGALQYVVKGHHYINNTVDAAAAAVKAGANLEVSTGAPALFQSIGKYHMYELFYILQPKFEIGYIVISLLVGWFVGWFDVYPWTQTSTFLQLSNFAYAISMKCGCAWHNFHASYLNTNRIIAPDCT